MARAQFDKQQVLENASNAFWRLGYNATSMQTVVAETGLKPGSIYLAFGNKEGLFKESLDFYTQQSLSKLEVILSQYTSAEEAIPHILMNLINESCQTEYYSCFLVKSQLELNADQTELKEYVSQQLRKVETLYKSYFLKKYSEEEASARAASVMLHVFGIRVYGYHNHSKEQLINAAQVGMPWLNWTTAH